MAAVSELEVNSFFCSRLFLVHDHVDLHRLAECLDFAVLAGQLEAQVRRICRHCVFL